MSVSLGIYWPDGSFEDVPLAGQCRAKFWAELARSRGLEWVPHFHSFLVVDAGNVDQIIAEMGPFREALVNTKSDVETDLEAVDRLTAAVQKLKNSEGWKASIG